MMTNRNTTTTSLSAAETKRLGQVLALAEDSANPALGERLAALSVAEKLLGRHGLRLRDLAATVQPPADDERDRERYGDSDDDRGWSPHAQQPEWKRLVVWCLTHPTANYNLSDWDRRFLASLANFPSCSARQSEVLQRIVRRLRTGSRS
jgi:hypothetical protein